MDYISLCARDLTWYHMVTKYPELKGVTRAIKVKLCTGHPKNPAM